MLTMTTMADVSKMAVIRIAIRVITIVVESETETEGLASQSHPANKLEFIIPKLGHYTNVQSHRLTHN